MDPSYVGGHSLSIHQHTRRHAKLVRKAQLVQTLKKLRAEKIRMSKIHALSRVSGPGVSDEGSDDVARELGLPSLQSSYDPSTYFDPTIDQDIMGMASEVGCGPNVGINPATVEVPYPAQRQHLSEVFARFNRGEQPHERGGRPPPRGFSLAEVQMATDNEQAVRSAMGPAWADARARTFAAEQHGAHEQRRRARRITSEIMSPAKSVLRRAGHIVTAVPGVRLATKTLAKVMQNPIVDTLYGQVTVPANIALGFAKGGPKGALAAAKKELRNPVRRAAVSALGTIFPPAAPAAVALNAANVLLDAAESKDPVAAAKAVMQLAAISAGSQGGDLHLKEVSDVVQKAKAARDMIPKSAAPALASARTLVCGAKGEDQKGIWFKLNVRREGSRMVATLYSVAAGNAEISNFSIDLRPLARFASTLHARMHSGGRLTKAGQRAALRGESVSGLFDGLQATVQKLGRAKLQSMASEKTNLIAKKAGCIAQKPPAPVSDAALASYAAARSGVEAVDNVARVERAVAGSTSALKKYAAVKGVLSGMSVAQKAAALKRPEVQKAVIDGVAAKGTLASFATSGGPQKLAAMRAKAALAKRAFRNIRAKAEAGDPDAKKMAAVVSVAAKARADIQSSAAESKGGLPGLVIGPNGKLRRGRFKKRAPRTGEGTSLILTKQGLQAGVFDSVSGLAETDNYLDLVAEDQLPFELSDDSVSGNTKVCCYGG